VTSWLQWNRSVGLVAAHRCGCGGGCYVHYPLQLEAKCFSVLQAFTRAAYPSSVSLSVHSFIVVERIAFERHLATNDKIFLAATPTEVEWASDQVLTCEA